MASCERVSSIRARLPRLARSASTGCGAFGFRDQLQDVTASRSRTRDTRRPLLRAAARQFVDGECSTVAPAARSCVRTQSPTFLCCRTRHAYVGDGDARSRRMCHLTGRARAGPHERTRPRVPPSAARVRALRPRARQDLTVGAHGLRDGTGDGRRRTRGAREGRGKASARVVACRLSELAPRRRALRGQRAWAWSRASPRLTGAPRRMGWRLVSPRVFRRWHAPGLCRQRRVPHRFDRAIVERDLGRR